jgi:hypothetical protein
VFWVGESDIIECDRVHELRAQNTSRLPGVGLALQKLVKICWLKKEIQ